MTFYFTRLAVKSASRIKFQVFLAICLMVISFGASAETIVTSPGVQKSVAVRGAMRSSITNPDIASAETSSAENQVTVTGISPGNTEMIVWLENGKKIFYIISVVEREKNTEKDLQGLLSGIEGIHIKSTSSGVIVSGQVYRGDDLDTLQKALRLYPGVQNYTKVNPQALEYFQQAMIDKLHEQGFNQIQISKATDTLYLEGFVPNALEKTRAEKIAKSIYIKTENHLELGIENKNLILVDVKFMEIMKNSLNNLGIRWPQSIDVNTSVQLSQNVFSTILSTQNTIQLNALIEKGNAKVLSNPKLLCQSGFPASFDAGGEIPIRLISERTADVMFKSYGLHLDIKAKSDAGQRASIEIQSRISDLDLATAVDGIPGILEHKVNTAVNLNFGQTVALAGLIEGKSSKGVTKMPVLGHIPILGELFKSRNFRNQLSEFVVFLTPILANGDDPYHQQQKNMTDQKWSDQDKRIKFSLTD